MASDLLSIGASGARVARSALDVTAQNIANASTEGYVRRSARAEEISAMGGWLRIGDFSLSGARVTELHRNADSFRQAEVRRTGSDLARATTELGGLEDIETAIDQAGVYDAIVEFEASLQQLTSGPTDLSLRAPVLSSADALARKFNIAAESLDAASEGMRFNAGMEVEKANTIAKELTQVNLRLLRAGEGSSDTVTMLDRRDLLLEQLSGLVDIKTSFADDGTVTVTSGGQPLVTGGTAGELSMATAADGTVSFALDGNPVTLAGGSLAGAQLALAQAAGFRERLDTLADNIAGIVNTAQAAGVALDGSPGQPIFGGTGAGGIQLITSDSSALATAPAGDPANSRNIANLTALRDALETGGAAQSMNSLLFDVSSGVAGRRLTQQTLDAIATSAKNTLDQQAGVDLDTEAANLMRFQQAFQASARAMQVASDVFDTLFGIGQ